MHEPTIYRYEYRPRGTLDAKRDFTVARSKAEAERIVKGKLTAEYGADNFDLSELVESSFEEIPADDEAAFERLARELDRRKPKPPEVGPFWQFRIGENYRQRALVYADSKPAAVAKMTERLLADGGRFHGGSPAFHPAVESLTLDRLRSRLSNRGGVFAALLPPDAREFVADLLREHVLALLNWHRAEAARIEAEAGEGLLALPSSSKPPKPSALLLEGIEHVKANAAIDEESLPEAVHAEVV